VNIFANPKAETYATVGVTSGLSSAASDQPQFRYNAAGYYELQVPGGTWDKLVFPSNVVPADPATFNNFVTKDGASVFINMSRLNGYLYSELGNWTSPGKSGVIAFGSATPTGQVPTAGSASYNGTVIGTSDVYGYNFFEGRYQAPVSGTVQLNFDFARATLQGAMDISVDGGEVGSFAFTNTVFSAASNSYSGSFATSAAGQNFFLGQFTGPNAQETIGAWAIPFVFTNGTTSAPADGLTHQAYGAWIARH
jgi:hypothetical protein